MTDEPRASRAFRLAAVGLALVVLGVHVVRLVEPFGVDQGLFACFARWVPRGWLPYRDLFDSKPPLFLYSYALSALVPGDLRRAIWWVEGAFLAASLVAAYSLGRRLESRSTGLACAALLFLGLWSPAWGGFWSRAQAEELLVVPMLGSAWLAWRTVERERLAVWAGVLVGVCGLFKIPSMAIAGAWMTTWLLTVPAAGALRRIVLLGCGVVVPWLLATAWFATHGALGDFVTGVLVYQRHIAVLMAPPWLDVVEDFTETLVTRAALLVLAAALGLYRMAEENPRALRWVAPWIGFTMAAVVAQRQLADYHYLLTVPALAVAGGYGVASVARDLAASSRGRRGAALACVVVLAVLAARDGIRWAHVYGLDALALAGRLPRDAYLHELQPGGFSMATEEEAARYLDEHTRPSDRVLVWGLSPGIYALADRTPATRFPFHKLLMTDAPLSRRLPGLDERRARLMEGLRADPPAYILVGRADSNGFEPEDSSSSLQRFPALHELVERAYRQETMLGRFLVLRRVAAGGAGSGADPLGAIHPSDAPLDWSRPLPVTPPGGVAEAGYVGSEACEGCHAAIAAKYARHSMARTGLRPLADIDPKWLASIFDAGAAVPVKHERSGFSYRPFRQGDRYFVEERYDSADGTRLETWVQPITHALSAGSYGMAFYFRSGERWYQVPVDYYAKLGRWDVDAGAANGADFRFSKSLQTSCIACHGDFPRRLAGRDDVFFDPMPAGVGCERCHGPGGKHAASLKREDIVDPARLDEARQVDVCAQCHESDHFGLRADRTDSSFRPGEPLDAHQVNWVSQPPEADRFILLAHPERMVESACWRGSRGSKKPLTCTSCHDPHVSSFDQPPSWWDSKCDACHADRKGCTLEPTARMARGGHCVGCHMRSGATSNVPLVAVTDHWIQTRPQAVRSGPAPSTEQLQVWSAGEGDAVTGPDVAALQSRAWMEVGRNDEALRLAAAAFDARPHVPRLYRWLAGRFEEAGDPEDAARMQAEVLRFDPDARDALLAYAAVRLAQGTPDAAAEGLRAVDRALAVDGADPEALEMKGVALFREGRRAEAKDLLTRAAAVGPSVGAANVGLAVLALQEGRQGEAASRLEAARRIEPTDPWILDRLGQTYAATGDRARADEVAASRRSLTMPGNPASGPTTATSWLPADVR